MRFAMLSLTLVFACRQAPSPPAGLVMALSSEPQSLDPRFGTDAKFFRWKGVPAYGFGLHSLRIPYTEYPVMFHGNNERVDTESLKLSAMMWEALCREFLG